MSMRSSGEYKAGQSTQSGIRDGRSGANAFDMQGLALSVIEGISELDASESGITELPANLADVAPDLEVIDCSLCALTSLPACISRLADLSLLNVSSNAIESLPTLPMGLLYLHAHSNKLTALPPMPTALRVLNVHHNMLSSLPHFAELRFLETLIVSSNPLRSFPQDLPLSLSVLTLDNIQLEVLPSVGQLTGLKSLSLMDNFLEQVPVSISQLTGLTVLSLARNRLRCVPSAMCTLTNLGVLALAGNPLLGPLLDRSETGKGFLLVSFSRLHLTERHAFKNLFPAVRGFLDLVREAETH